MRKKKASQWSSNKFYSSHLINYSYDISGRLKYKNEENTELQELLWSTDVLVISKILSDGWWVPWTPASSCTDEKEVISWAYQDIGDTCGHDQEFCRGTKYIYFFLPPHTFLG